jgi:hypothetical protein
MSLAARLKRLAERLEHDPRHAPGGALARLAERLERLVLAADAGDLEAADRLKRARELLDRAADRRARAVRP